MWSIAINRKAISIAALLPLTVATALAAEEPPGVAAPEPWVAPAGPMVRPSESPHLRPPDYLTTAEPITPYDGPPGQPLRDPTATITHTPATGQTLIVPSPADPESSLGDGTGSVEPFSGLALPILPEAGQVEERSVIGTDGRIRVTTTGVYPWRTVVRLLVRWTPSGGVGVCSGALISHYHVLTAGHCVYDYGGTNDWAYSIQVFPGLDDDDMPYNYAWATRYRSYTGWTGSGLTEHDWAVIALDRSVGSYTGWMGRQTDNPTSSIYTGILNTAGYPGTPNGTATCPTWANCQYWDSDDGYDASEYNHWYWMDTSGGQSGGPVWRYLSDTEERFILTTHTCGTGGCGVPSHGVNYGTRLNADKFDRIPTWISADFDIQPSDRADLLDDGQPYSGFSPTLVSGGQSFSAWSDVRNVGTAFSGSFYVSYYASTNTTITTGDYLIGNDLTGSISPFTWTDSNLDLTFPSGIPDGIYNVGWIIDRFGDVSEYDEGNNTAYQAGYQLTVCNEPATPSLLAPGDGTQTSDPTPTFDWSTVSGASSYRIQVDDSSTFSSPAIDTTTAISVFTPSSNLAPGAYHWRVRADKSCGTPGAWSPAHSLVISGGTSSSCDLKQVSNSTVGSTVTHGACRELRGGPALTITGTGDLTLEAGSRVILYDGFTVASGGSLKVQTCGHDLCTTGQAFSATCHSCVAAICDYDSYCCGVAWDETCVFEVGYVCGLACP